MAIPKGKHAGNCMGHLRRHHLDVHDRVKAEVDQGAQKTGPAKKAKPTVLNGVAISAAALVLHCTRLISEHGLSFKVLSYSAFQDIINPLLNAMPASERITISSNSIPPKISPLADKARDLLAEELQGRMVSLQVDGCSKKQRHFLGVVIQYAKDGKMQVRPLAVEEVFTSSSAEYLKDSILRILKRFGLSAKNIVAFTSDSGANYMKAGKLLQMEDEDEEYSDSEGDVFLQDATEEEFMREVEAVDLSNDELQMQSIRCAAHTLQLAVEEALKTTKGLKPTIDRARALVHYLRTSSVTFQLKAAKLPLPTLDVCTRWGSLYDMLTSVYNLKNFVQYTLVWTKKEDKGRITLSEEEWKSVEKIADDLAPARKACTQLQSESLTLGDFLAIWEQLTTGLQKKKTDLADTLLAAMASRSKSAQYSRKGKNKNMGEKLAPLFNYPAFSAAVFMDPRYFALLDTEQIAQAKTYLLELWKRLQTVKGAPIPTVEDEESPVDESDSDEDRAEFKKRLEARNKARRNVTSALVNKRSGLQDVAAVLENYDRSTVFIPVDADVFKYWEKRRITDPILYELALIVLAIPATQVCVERLFSCLRFIIRPQRFGLSGQLIDDVVFLHANPHLVKELVLFEW